MALTRIFQETTPAPGASDGLRSAPFVWPESGTRAVFVGGVFSGADVALEASPDDGATWYELSHVSAQGVITVTLQAGTWFSAVIHRGAPTTTRITVQV